MIRLWDWVKLRGQYVALGMVNRFNEDGTVEVVEPRTKQSHLVRITGLRKASSDEVKRLRIKLGIL